MSRGLCLLRCLCSSLALNIVVGSRACSQPTLDAAALLTEGDGEGLHLIQRNSAKIGSQEVAAVQLKGSPQHAVRLSWKGGDFPDFNLPDFGTNASSSLQDLQSTVAATEGLEPAFCLPDLPGNMRNAAICMAASMAFMAFLGYYLVHLASSLNERVPLQQSNALESSPSGQEPRSQNESGNAAEQAQNNTAMASARNAEVQARPKAAAQSGTQAEPSETTAEARAPPKNPSIEAVNGLRTVVVSYIILKHYPGGLPRWVVPVLIDGWSMQFFFVLSGFILQYVIAAKHEMLDRSAGLKLVVRRWMRLVPLYEVAIVMCFIPKWISNDTGQPFMAWPMNALMLQGLMPWRVCGTVTNWSLNFIHFNANYIGWFTAILAWVTCCFPMLYNILPREGVGKISALLLLMFFCRTIPEFVQPSWGCFNQYMRMPEQQCNGFMHLYAFAPLRVLEFAAGMLSMSLVTQVSSRVQAISWGWVFDAVLLTSIAGVALVTQKVGRDALFSGDFLLTPMWCLVCATACLGARQRASFPWSAGPLYAALSSWPLAPMGQYSFEAYILHHALLQGGAVTRFPLNLIFVWVVAIFVDKFIQDPLVKAVNVHLNRK